MTDIVDPARRSALMARIRGSNTKPERVLRSLLWHHGLRYRLSAKAPVGRPDLVFVAARVAVFVDGCFWHGCPDHYVRPRSRVAFWSGRLAENVARDRRQTARLTASGWTVVRIWEHEVFTDPDGCVARVSAALRGEPNAAPSADLSPREVVVRVDELDAEARIERRFIEAFDDPTRRREVVGPRVTAKWRRPKSS